MKAALALAVLVLALPAQAHEPMTAAAAESYLQQEERWRAATRPPSPSARRAEAHYRLGVLRDEMRDQLNAELAAHGRVQALAVRFLLQALQDRGVPMLEDPAARRYAPEDEHYAQALALVPGAPFAADAGLRLLQARFYGSFDQDPLDWKLDAQALRAQIALAEDLLARFPEHAAREEIEFIAAILYTRAARLPEGAKRYAHLARAAAEAFAQRYPGSLRAAAMPVL
ncbi:MAG: hypothetical protein ACREVD_03685, partial [Burkholderiales bacterium]